MDLVLAIAGGITVLTVMIGVMLTRFYRKVPPEHALVVNNIESMRVVLSGGAIVYPVIHKAEEMDISFRTIQIVRSGSEGMICADNIRADIHVEFFVRVNRTEEDILKVAQSVGCARASDPITLQQLFVAKFSEALKTVGKKYPFERLHERLDEFRYDVIHTIGRDLNGYVLEDVAIESIQQTPLEALDPNNILDAAGIRAIVERTAERVSVQKLLVALASHREGDERARLEQLITRAIELGVA